MKITTKFLITGLLVCLSILLLQVISPDIAYAAVRVCSGGDCWYTECRYNSDCGANGFVRWSYSCQQNNFYQDYVTYTCNNSGTPDASCSATKSSRLVQTCDSSQKCETGLWFAGCASRTTSTCSPNASLKCFENSVYWYDSCSNRQSLYQTCGFNQTCGGGSCVATQAPSQPTYILRASKGCFNNSAYWYDSSGNRQTLIKNCSLTGQTCQIGQCIGSTAPSVSTSTPTIVTTNIITSAQEKTGDLVVSLFVKKDTEPLQWGKSVSAKNGEIIKFLAIVKNNSNSSVSDIYLRVNFINAVVYAGNLKINEIPSEGNVANGGILLGTIGAGDSKAILFDSTTQYQTGNNEFSITANVIRNNVIYDTDIVAVQIASTASTAAISETGIWGLIRQWFLWLVLIAVIIVLFVIIFRRVSS